MAIRIPFLKLPASQPSIAREYPSRIARVLERGQFILGEEVGRFEREFAKFCGAKFCVGVGNGTEALQMALRLSGLRPGSGQEVITTPLTASFTAHAIVAAGARPVFADVDPQSLLLDPAAVRTRMTARTAAIVPVHLYGACCDLETFRWLAKERGCALIQDAAQAHGSDCQGRPLADYSDWVAFSFYPTKNLGALGDGGALVTNRRALAEAARRFRDGGRSGASHVAHTEGINSRLDELQATLLRVHLRHLKAWNRRREALAARYDRLLREDFLPQLRGHVQILPRRTHGRSANHLYVIRVADRDSLRAHLLRRGIDTGIHYETPLHLQPGFRWLGYRRGDFPQAERAAREVCSLPLHPFLSNQGVDIVVEEIVGFFHKK
ncbi:MAG: DegT/DnrJ/EryC1/StrS family aminotransferase [Acidobacteria bacterium]|nr:DegT/DnrJ/EryC1/StrS family aminotransferase [Acidobacteriota bacterium]